MTTTQATHNATPPDLRRISEDDRDYTRLHTRTVALPAIDLRHIALDEGADGFHRSWIMLFPEGHYEHGTYGKLDFSRKTLSEIKSNFDGGAREIEIAIDRDHKAGDDDSRAMGWIEQLELREGAGDLPAGLWAQVRWTPLGLCDVRDQVYRYFSPEYRPEYKNQITGKTYHNVLIGGALTNRPFLKAMHAIQLSHTRRDGQEGRRLMEISHTPWSQIDKDCLPRSAFLDPGDPDHPSTWRLPVFEGTGSKDAHGRYTKRGALNLNGVRAALAALGGARQSAPMTGVPAGVKERLARWMARYGAEGSGRAASERTGLGTRSALTGQSKRGNGGKERQRNEEGEMTPMGKTRGNAALKAVEDASMGLSDEELEFDDGGEAFADDMGDDSEEYDDGEADGGGGDEGEFDDESDTHGPMSVDSHTHGKYAAHGHDGDGDHSDAPLAESGGRSMSGGSRKASERAHLLVASGRRSSASVSGRTARDGDETRQLREELASVRYELYEGKVNKTLDTWRSQTFQFKENPKAAPKSGRIALSRVFADKYRDFMLTRAIRLSEGDRGELNALIETALSTAIVDLTSRGVSYDMEGRRTIKGGDRQRGAHDSDQLQERVEQMLTEKGQQLSELSEAQTLALYERAAKEIGYH